jgi:hypothetical protein
MITPRLVLQVHVVASVIAYCHRSDGERNFRLERIRACWLASQIRQLWVMNPPGTRPGHTRQRTPIAASLALGGADGKTLHVTHSHRSDFGHMKIPGRPVPAVTRAIGRTCA